MSNRERFEQVYNTKSLDQHQYQLKYQAYRRELENQMTIAAMQMALDTNANSDTSLTVNSYIEDDYIENYFE